MEYSKNCAGCAQNPAAPASAPAIPVQRGSMAKAWNPCPLCGGVVKVMSDGPRMHKKPRGLAMRTKTTFGCQECGLWLTEVIEYDYGDRTVETDELMAESLACVVSKWNSLGRRRADG